MGASQSVAHPDPGHRLTRFESNPEVGVCGMCSLPVQLTAAAYRCGHANCRFVLHDACFRFPKKIKRHFAHPDHTLRLSSTHQLQVAGLHCGICARELNGAGDAASSFVYSCNKCHGGFYAHPRCCMLPETKTAGALHEHTLTLRAPPHKDGRRCINRTGNCRNARRLTSHAWSYQCSFCVTVQELCLACQMPDHDGHAAAHHHHHRSDGCNVVFQTTMHWIGTGIGNFLGSMTYGCLGIPRPPPQPPARVP